MTSEQLLKAARVAFFKDCVGCCCFVCHCQDWQQVQFTMDEVRELPKQMIEIDDAACRRERDGVMLRINQHATSAG